MGKGPVGLKVSHHPQGSVHVFEPCQAWEIRIWQYQFRCSSNILFDMTLVKKNNGRRSQVLSGVVQLSDYFSIIFSFPLEVWQVVLFFCLPLHIHSMWMMSVWWSTGCQHFYCMESWQVQRIQRPAKRNATKIPLKETNMMTVSVGKWQEYISVH